MSQVYVKYNPYKMETQIAINGKAIITDSGLYKKLSEEKDFKSGLQSFLKC